MFERFSEEARQVVVLAQEEARSLRHCYIGTEHILLGLLRCDDNVAPGVLEAFGFTLDRVRAEILRIVAAGEEPPPNQIPFTPRAKKVLELSLREALGLDHNYIGPGHILLGLLHENEGVAARIVSESDADPESIRRQTIEALAAQPAPGPGESVSRVGQASATTRPALPPDAAWLGASIALDGLGRDIRRELGREPDGGDLLLVLACAQGTVASEALGELGVDLDELWGRVEIARREALERRVALERKLTDVRAEKEAAIEAQDFQRAAELRDSQRELTAQLRRVGVPGPDALREIRRRLGLPEA